MRNSSILCVIFCMLTLSNCAPPGRLSSVSGIVTEITAGVVDVVNNAVEKIAEENGRRTSNTTSNDNTSDYITVARDISTSKASQEDFDKFIVDIFTGIQAIIISAARNIGQLGKQIQ